VFEGGLKFWVNFRDYLDTGLFLDHRIVRARLRDWAQGADFLNLFCYTGSATVYAAAGGARSTTGVDLSNTYLDWAHENLLLNGFGDPKHELYRADCPAVARGAGTKGPRFDLVRSWIRRPSPPSKRMDGVLDVQRDHVGMIRRSMKLLRPSGRLVSDHLHALRCRCWRRSWILPSRTSAPRLFRRISSGMRKFTAALSFAAHDRGAQAMIAALK
jgi:23S rRNA G2069 N7-methylase RlmK/C1962 C5-methylase RlmI